MNEVENFALNMKIDKTKKEARKEIHKANELRNGVREPSTLKQIS